MEALTQADWMAVRLSIEVAVFATAVSLPLGFLVAYAMAFGSFPGKTLLEAAVNLPLTLPPVVVGYLLLLLLGRNGWLGAWLEEAGLRVVFTFKAAVAASAVVGFPLLVRSTRSAMEAIDPQALHAARTLGARRADAMLTVVLPLSLPGLLAGASLMFVRSLGEFGATIIVAGNIPGVTRTIPLAIHEHASSPGGEGAALALCAAAAAVSLAVLLLNGRLERRIAGKAQA